MITAVIIDDEPKSVYTLSSFLQIHCPQVKLLGSADNAREARELIMDHAPQLVFLDIEMPLGSGFDLLKSFTCITFEIIFITAYNQYAISAFRFSALDYLLKPLRISQLIEAVEKAEMRIAEKKSKHNYELLLKNLGEKTPGMQKIVLNEKGNQFLVQMDDLIYLIAEGSYTNIRIGDKFFLSSKNLKDYEEMLPPEIFYRIHHGHIININHVTKLQKGRGGKVIMKDGKELEIAVRRRDGFLKAYNL